jgi:hypothetical protein
VSRRVGVRNSFIHVFSLILALISVGLGSCSKKTDPASKRIGEIAPAVLASGRYLPDSGVVGNSVIKGTVTVSRSELYYTNVSLVQFDQPWGSRELLINLGTYAAGDFGPLGSMTLVAETQDYPLEQGGAFPVLTEFYVVPTSGPTINYVKLKNACVTEGMWNCDGGFCGVNPNCTTDTGSSFGGRNDWDQHQIPPYGYATTNAFPRCDGAVNSWNCPVSGQLPAGQYFAKYVLMSDSGGSVDNLLAGLKVSVIVKKDTAVRESLPVNGGVNINLILVGDQNINDSLSVRGARNLDLLFKEVNRLLKVASGAKIGINALNVFEWNDENGGSQYSQVDYLDLGNMFEAGSKASSLSSTSGNAINIFLVSDISYANTSNLRILGVSGGILGPPVHGTQTSGLAFSSGNELAVFNPKCLVSNCHERYQENDFREMAATITHELGHFLGLNHPSENASGASQSHDALNDTPLCVRSSVGNMSQRTCYYNNDSVNQAAPLGETTCKLACDAATTLDYYLASPRSPAVAIDLDPANQTGSYQANDDMPREFCPAVQQCQFNHVMWYTTKNRQLSAGGVWSEDGNIFSPQSSATLQWSPLVR